MNRRSFLGSILAACAAPAMVRASSLMPGRALERLESGILVPSYDPFWIESPRIIPGQTISIRRPQRAQRA